ncbi:hypothetical protein D0A34_11290 [Microcoleus vaginatus PCC 9802]|nr:hypothetical protein D0A34_11290 [Microcoleus vaginatus PCC 9802]
MARGTADDWQLSAGELEVESQPEAEQSRLELLVNLLPCYLVLKMLKSRVKLSSIVETALGERQVFNYVIVLK